MPGKDIPIGEPKEGDDFSIMSPDGLYLTIEIQKGVTKGVKGQFDRYIEICGNSSLDSSQWMNREDFLIFCLCTGLGFKDMLLSDIVNQALVAGCLNIAEFHTEMENKINGKG